MRLLSSVCYMIALLTGLVAAYSSQASSPDYRSLFLWVLGETIVCATCTACSLSSAKGIDRWILLAVIALAVAGCVELGARLLGVRLLG